MNITILKKTEQFNNSFFSLIDKRSTIVILVFILINLILKCYNLSEAPYYLDEATSIFMAQKPFAEIIKESLSYPHPPLYTLILSGWIKIGGISELGTRLLSVLFSVLTIPLLFRLGKKFFNIQTALFVLIIFTASNQHMYYSHETRSYTLVCFLTVLSFYLYFKILQNRKIKTLFIYFLTNTILIYIHIIPLLVLFVQFIGSLFYFRTNRKTVYLIVLAQFFSVVLLGIWILNNNWIGGGETVWLPKPNLDSVYMLFRAYFNTNLALFIGLFAVLLLILRRNKTIDKKRFLILIFWGILPILMVFIGSHVYNPRFIPKYMLFATPGLYFIIAYIISSLRFHYLVRIGLILAIFIESMIHINLNPYKGEDWHDAANYIKKTKKQEELLIVCADYQYVPFSFYYNRDAFRDYKNTNKILAQDNIYFTKTSYIFEIIDESQYNNTFLLLSHDKIADPDGTTFNYLAERYHLIEEIYEFEGIKIFSFNTSKSIKKAKLFFDFENHSKYHVSITDSENTHSGKKVSMVNETIEYSAGYDEPLGDIVMDSLKMVNITAWLYYDDPKVKARLVCSFENNKGIIQWKALDIQNTTKPGEWTEVRFKVPIPENLNSEDILKIYLWNPFKHTILLDDLYVSFI